MDELIIAIMLWPFMAIFGFPPPCYLNTYFLLLAVCTYFFSFYLWWSRRVVRKNGHLEHTHKSGKQIRSYFKHFFGSDWRLYSFR